MITALDGEDSEYEDWCGCFFENSTNPKRFYLNMAQLLAHPLQRQPESKPTKIMGDKEKK